MAWRVAFGTVYPRICPSCARSCRGRRVPAPTARAMGAGLHRPCCARVFRVSFRRKKRASPHPVAAYAGPPARTSRQRFGGPQTRNLNRRGGRWPRPPLVSVDSFGSLCHLRWQQPTGLTLPSVPSKMHSYRPASPGGRGVCALGRKHSLRRPPPAPKGSVCPVGTCAKRKATRRREQIQGLRAASAQNADICEVPAAKPPAK